MDTQERPVFPQRAVITGGMPYGDKPLHFGHVGGNLLHADIYARFLRGRIGKDNVIFVSGTDCYGAGIEVKYQGAVAEGFTGTILDYVRKNHELQKEVLKKYNISLTLYGASALEPAGENHKKLSADLFLSWYENGYLRMEEIEQFYDEETQTFLNGRQVVGRCPINKCQSETAYADECALGHQYNPQDLIAPKVAANGKTPTLKKNTNWYFDLERFSEKIKARQESLKKEGISRKFLLSYIDDFLKPPIILVKTEDFATLRLVCETLPPHTAKMDEENKSAVLTFSVLKDREEACKKLREHNIRFRNDTTLVPFRLSGNVAWGIPVPDKENVQNQTFWVWPESLWAPISFLITCLEQQGQDAANWEKWWCDPEARVYQFIGEDNIYFYGIAAMGLFMALNEIAGRDPLFNLPVIIPNRHVFFGNRKASSSGKLVPPTADALLAGYTAEQLRLHFAHMALQANSAKFAPKALLNGADAEGFDTTLVEGNILTNVFNRLVRSCFYSVQKYCDGKLPTLPVSEDVKKAADTLIHEYEWTLYRFEFTKAIDLLDVYLRDANKKWAAESKKAGESEDKNAMAQVIVDGFHVVRIAAALFHPFAPEGTGRVRDYLQLDERIWDWSHIYEPLTFFMKADHAFTFLEPKVDFFLKHPTQLNPSATA